MCKREPPKPTTFYLKRSPGQLAVRAFYRGVGHGRASDAHLSRVLDCCHVRSLANGHLKVNKLLEHTSDPLDVACSHWTLLREF